MRNIIITVAIAITIALTGCARSAQIQTPNEVVADVAETEIVQITVFASSLYEAEEQVASAGYSVAGSPRRTTAWLNGGFIVPATR